MNYMIKSSAIIVVMVLIAGFSIINGTYAQETTYKIGDQGPAGGLIFYDKGNSSGGWRYLEAAPEDQSEGAEWGCYKKIIPGEQGPAVGSGKGNTQEIVKGCKETNIAAKIAVEYKGGGKSDWFLPSKDELNALYNNLHKIGIGGFASYGYWSSTEDKANHAWYHGFSTGSQNSFNKYNSSRVRAIRAF